MPPAKHPCNKPRRVKDDPGAPPGVSGHAWRCASPQAQNNPLNNMQNDLDGIVVTPNGDNISWSWKKADLRSEKLPARILQYNALHDLPLTRLLGFHLCFYPWNGTSHDGRHNHLTQILTANADWARPAEEMKEAGFGAVPILGTVMLVRADQQPLLEKHIEVFIAYIETRLQPIVYWGLNNTNVHMTVDYVRRFQNEFMRPNISPGAFRQFWNEYQATKIQEGLHEWRDVECPVTDGPFSSACPPQWVMDER